MFSPYSAFRQLRIFSTLNKNAFKSPLHDIHIEMGAAMGDFFKYRLPASIGSEGEITSHLHSRTFASIFDLSFYKHIVIKCKSDLKFLDSIISADLSALKPGHSCDTFIVNDGKIFDHDDKIILSTYGNMGDTLNILRESAKQSNAQIDSINCTTIYLEGPTSSQVLSDTLNIGSQLKGLYNNTGVNLDILNNKCYLIRRGLIQDDSYQIIIITGESDIYRQLLKHDTVMPAGMNTYLSIALESGAPIPGVDINQDLTPHEATMPHCISKTKSDMFDKGIIRRYILKLEDGPLPTVESKIFSNDSEVGKITSVHFSPIYQSLLASGLIKCRNGQDIENLSVRFDNAITTAQVLNKKKQ